MLVKFTLHRDMFHTADGPAKATQAIEETWKHMRGKYIEFITKYYKF